MQKLEKFLILAHGALECRGFIAAVADTPTPEAAAVSPFLPDGEERVRRAALRADPLAAIRLKVYRFSS